jgi:DNA-binding GntR family transcriptional regulator
MLEKEGFVTIIPRKGANVSGISKEEVKNIWEIRSILEPYAARTAALKCQENELNKIGDQLNKILQEPYDFSDYTNSDMELHELLYKHLENKMLKEIIVLVKQNVLRILNSAQVKSAFSKNIAFRDTREHVLIIEALKAHDPERTGASVYLHIMNSKQRILQALDTHN